MKTPKITQLPKANKRLMITQDDFLKMERRARRESEISNGSNITLNKVHKDDKVYSRKVKYKNYLDV